VQNYVEVTPLTEVYWIPGSPLRGARE